MYLAVAIIALFLTQPATAAGWWDDFTNNLATDLAPFIALLGERPAQQFLSESTSTWDYLIFAMAPLGIVTTIVSSIRVGGGPSLRAFIGRAQEGQRQVEAELCSSTSADVCEMYNNGGIARVFGNAKILEVVVDHKEEVLEDKGERLELPSDKKDACLLTEAKSGIYTFRDYERVTRDDDGREWKYRTPKGVLYRVRTGLRWLRTKLSPSQNTRPSEQKEPEYAPNPNLTLNIWMRQRSTVFLQVVAATGMAIQSGVVLAAMIITYYFRLKKEDGPAAPYAAPLMGIGTVFLAAGAFLSAYIIGEATYESKFERSKTPKTELIVLQPGGQVIGDQHFESFAYNDHGATRTYVSSSKPRHVKPRNRVVVFSIVLTAGGFILQFVGLRGLHSSVAVAQLGATIIMSGIRASLRSQRLSSSRNLLQGTAVEGHELDWLALYIGGRDIPGDGPEGTLTSEGTPPASPSPMTAPREDIESKAGTKDPPGSQQPKPSKFSPTHRGSGSGFGDTSGATSVWRFWKRWFRGRHEVPNTRRIQRRIRFFGMTQETPQAFLFPQYPRPDSAEHPHQSPRPVITGSLTEPGFKDEDTPHMRVSTAQRLLAYRTRLARLTKEQGAMVETQPAIIGSEPSLVGPGPSVVQRASIETRPRCMLDWGDELVVVRETSRRLASAIREMADIFFSDDCQLRGSWKFATSFRWPISCVVSDELHRENELDTVYITLRRSTSQARWTLDPAQMEAVLGLWLFSLNSDVSVAAHDSPRGTRLHNDRIITAWATLGNFEPTGYSSARVSRYIETAGYSGIGTRHRISDARNVWTRAEDTYRPLSLFPESEESDVSGYRARLFGWHSTYASHIRRSSGKLEVDTAPTDDDLRLLLAQEVLGCFLRAVSSIVSHIGGRMKKIPGSQLMGKRAILLGPRNPLTGARNTFFERLKMCCMRHELGAAAEDTAHSLLAGLVSSGGPFYGPGLQYAKRNAPRKHDVLYDWNWMGDAAMLSEKAIANGLDISDGLKIGIDRGKSWIIMAHADYFRSLAKKAAVHKDDSNSARPDGGALTKGVIMGHISAVLTAYDKFDDHYLLILAIEIMADLCHAEELEGNDLSRWPPDQVMQVMQERQDKGKPPTTSPINLAAYLGLRVPLMSLLRRLWEKEESYRGPNMLKALHIAAHRGDAEMVEELVAKLSPISDWEWLWSGLRCAVNARRDACVYILAAACVSQKSYMRSSHESCEGPTDYHELTAILDALWYPAEARLTGHGQVERVKN